MPPSYPSTVALFNFLVALFNLLLTLFTPLVKAMPPLISLHRCVHPRHVLADAGVDPRHAGGGTAHPPTGDPHQPARFGGEGGARTQHGWPPTVSLPKKVSYSYNISSILKIWNFYVIYVTFLQYHMKFLCIFTTFLRYNMKF